MLDLSGPLVLDGGLSTALEQQGADLGGALWTARLLADEPARIAAAHRSFFDAGARVATTASYQASVEGLVAAGYDATEARRLIASSVTIAREVADEYPGSLVAASVGPYGAYLADGSEYTGRYGVTAARLRDFHGPRLELLAGAGPDLFAVETIPDADEAEVLVELLDEIGLPAWFSYSVKGNHTPAGPAARRGVRGAHRVPLARRRRRQLLGPVRRARGAVEDGRGRDRPARGGVPEPRRQLGRRGQAMGVRRPARPRPGRGLAGGGGPPGGRLLRQRSGRHRGPGGKCRRHTSWVDCAG